MAMEHKPVRSRDIAIVGYDSEQRILEIAFRSGGVYQFRDFPQEEYEAFMAAGSMGIFFDQRIKDKYPYERIR